MRPLFILASIILFVGWSRADELSQQLDTWKAGDEVPNKLLSFPTGNVTERGTPECGLAAYAQSVRPYIDRVESDALLEEILFEPRSDSVAFQAAAARLVQRKGLPWLSRMLGERASAKWEIGLLQQALQAPAARIEVAFISKDAMDLEKAKDVLDKLQASVDRGANWREAYAATSDANPDIERRKKEPQVSSTLVGYWYSGWISGSGFSFSEMASNANVPVDILKVVVGGPRGGHVLAAKEGVYLIYIYETWMGRA